MDALATTSLRSYLRAETRAEHDRLDATNPAEGLADPALYSRFLKAQLRARIGIEAYARQHSPQDLCPPPTADLLIEDLQQLGESWSRTAPPFELPRRADPVGLAWAIAGSQMGNRSMLAHMRKTGVNLPDRFLSDDRMITFWKTLRPRIECAVPIDTAQAAAIAARAVFAHFLKVFDGGPGQVAA